jgi:purine-binding chemotaxis protein CheW
MAKEVKLLVFNLGEQFFSANIMEIERILPYEIPTKLPDSPNFLEGVINYEGKILPIISLSTRFNTVSIGDAQKSCIIVSRCNDKVIGVIVDTVHEVKSIYEDAIEEAPEISSKISRRYIKGLVKDKDKIIVLLALEKVLSEEEIEEI